MIASPARRAAAAALVSLGTSLVAAAPAAAQQPRPAVTAADYARAERFLPWNVAPLASVPSVRPTWMAGGLFTYRAADGRAMLVDPARGTRDAAADRALGTPVGAAGTNAARSPDGRLTAFIRADNLWVRETGTGKETQLTTDGVKDFGYATDNAGWVRSDRPILAWSPDSKRIATFQQDQRGVGEMYVVQTKVGHPVLEQWKYPLVGDSVVAMIQRVVIDLSGPAPRVVRLQMPPDQHRSTLCDHITCGGEWADVEWSADGRRLFFASTSRDHRQVWVREADPSTGAVREVMTETTPNFYESGTGKVNWHPLAQSNELLWFSERDDWGNLYLYDLATGKQKRQITRGPGNVLQVLRVDAASRTVWFTAVGREAGRDPYLRHLYSVKLDGGAPTLLTPEDADHDVTLSPDGKWFVDAYSRVDVPPTVVVRSSSGHGAAQVIERSDLSRLVATGWTPPLSFTVKARDGKTDLYGLMFRPTNFDSTKKYPIVNQVYPGPQTGSVGSRSFSAARGDARALAELGFIVVQIDAMGTPLRSKSFHAAYYGDLGDNGLPDQVAGMRELAQKHAYVDLDRAGIWGHSGGGYAAADAMFRYPDFFKVGISEAGNHDNRNYEDDWGEKWQGLETRDGGKSSYDAQANQTHAAALRGKLLIAYGTADNNVPPENSLLVVNALIAANRDFDLLALPNRRHGFGSEPYMIRRRWDYFVTNLMGAAAPAGYEIRGPGARTAAR